MAKVSIIMPAYNCEQTIRRTIQSVLKQSFKEFEFIIVNDGSSDSTKQICDSIEDKRIIVVHKKNEGPSSARNEGLRRAQGKYIMFIDADDLFMEKTVEIMYNAIETKNVDIVAGSYISFDDSKEHKPIKLGKFNITNKKEKYIDVLQKKNALNSNWNKIYKKDIIDNNNILFDTTREIGEDLRFNFDYIKYAERFYIVNKIIYKYYINNNGLTRKNISTKAPRIITFLDYQNKYYNKLDLDNSKFQNKVFKDFFYAYGLNDETDMNFKKLLKEIKNKKMHLKILNWICNNKRLAKLIVAFYNKVRG